MPPKQKITKDMILVTAREIVRNEGIESINSRNVAKKLGCSTQPIFSQFPTMEELRKDVHLYCCEVFETEVLEEKETENFLQQSYLKVIHLAKEEKQLFRLIFLSEYCLGSEFMQIRMTYESNNRIVTQIMNQYGLDEIAGRDILQRVSLLLQGIATLIATTNVEYSDDEVCGIMEQTIHDMVAGIKNRNKDNKSS